MQLPKVRIRTPPITMATQTLATLPLPNAVYTGDCERKHAAKLFLTDHLPKTLVHAVERCISVPSVKSQGFYKLDNAHNVEHKRGAR